MSCAQLEVTSGGNASPKTVSFPGAYTRKHGYALFSLPRVEVLISGMIATSPGIVANIFSAETYTPPGKHINDLLSRQKTVIDACYRACRLPVLRLSRATCSCTHMGKNGFPGG